MEKIEQITQTTPTQSQPAADVKSESVSVADPLLGGYYLTNPFFFDIANFFGIESKDFDVAKDKLSVIADYAYQEAGSKSPEDVLLKIRDLEDKIQRPDWGERRYNNVYKYVRLASQEQRVRKAMSAYERSDLENGKSR